jgi:hypothetical protein
MFTPFVLVTATVRQLLHSSNIEMAFPVFKALRRPTFPPGSIFQRRIHFPSFADVVQPALLSGPQFTQPSFDPDDPSSMVGKMVENNEPPDKSTVIEWSAAFSFPDFHPVVKFGQVHRSPLTTRMDWTREYETRTFRLVVFRNYFVQGHSGIFRCGKLYARSRFPWFDGDIEFPQSGSQCIAKLDEVIASSHQAPANIAHWTFDFTCWLVLWPREILARCYFVTYWDIPRRYVQEVMELFNLTSRVVMLKRTEFVFARLVYAIDPLPADCQEPVALTQFRQWIGDYLGLDVIPPSKYVSLEREKGKTRCLSNARAVVRRFEETTGTRWVVVHGMPSMLKSAKFFNTALILLAVHGAGCVNIIYMQPGTVYIDIQSTPCNWAFWNMSRIAGLHHIATQLPGMQLMGESTPEAAKLDLFLAERMLRIALMQLKGGTVSQGTEPEEYIKLNI